VIEERRFERKDRAGLMSVIMALLIPAPYSGAETSEAEIGRLRNGSVLVKSELSDDGLICYVLGNVDEATEGEFGRAVTQLPAGQRVVFELSAVPYMDTTGLAVLVSAVTLVRAGGGEAVLCAPTPPVRRLFESAHFGLVATVHETLDEVLD
jgi:anti-anti-sigma factor